MLMGKCSSNSLALTSAEGMCGKLPLTYLVFNLVNSTRIVTS